MSTITTVPLLNIPARGKPVASLKFTAALARDYRFGHRTMLMREVACCMELYRESDVGKICWYWEGECVGIDLLFQGNKLIDYGGVLSLPMEARRLLLDQGYDLRPVRYDADGNEFTHAPFNPGQHYESVQEAFDLARRQPDPLEAAIAIVAATIRQSEFGFASELVQRLETLEP